MIEFDKILAKCTMIKMVTNIDAVRHVAHFKEIVGIFHKRAKNREFLSDFGIVYLQFARFYNQGRIQQELVDYSFNTIYHKMPWIDRIYAYEISVKAND
jgi:hypothetical protein